MSQAITNAERFILANTEITTAPLLPEIRLHLASDSMPLWQATEDELAEQGLPPPFWAFAWVGGQALARHVLDHPHLVAGRRVFDFAAGSGLGAIAALKAGARAATANDIDAFALAALCLNGRLNDVAFEQIGDDVIGRRDLDCDVFLAGDVCYEQPMAGRVADWLRQLAGDGVLVLLGDPKRAYLPDQGLEKLAEYWIKTTRDLEDRPVRRTSVWRVLP